MIPGRMSRSVRVLFLAGAAMAAAAIVAACGTEHIKVPSSSPLHSGAVLFSQRCGGCHTFSYAGTHGSAPNVRTAQSNSGPNFDQRCERPVDRVLYAIENGGFSGAYMPQNIVLGQDAAAVARFVATYAGRSAPNVIGIPKCESKPVGSLPSASVPTATTAASATTTSSATTAASATTSSSATSSAHKASRASKSKKKHKKSARS
jgi:mono/diheme cytochrome c family protein